MKKQLTFYLVRHGRTVWNEQGLLQGQGDSPLIAEGIEGAMKTGEHLANVPFVAAYSSVLKRAMDTTQYIIGERNIPFFQHKGLNEHFFGSWEGVLVDSIRQSEEFQQMTKDPANYQAKSNGGETFTELAERAMQAVYDIINVHNKGNILLVSHGHTLRLLLALFDGSTWQNHRENPRVIRLDNTSISIVHYEQAENENVGRFVLETVNSTAHL
ncbi:histidine phosphatase family protein [Avibacterium gallinarum]|uniref:Phosphoglycerate mutase n=1 Tax=Avibacterium gallinarum TaxID=755 RepID=A0A379AVN0_AVIGA|nr:histidine phosphatase family protein [Avibacterium gallinarum]POY45040.1 histidine phosphatase family protein [Avibacterium gallinarum]TDP28840.1 putative phosphoglycerate mutase [Avibacterium gallinarum]SUB26377.1 protein GpmB [Avibacterium gallinarum]